MAEQLEITETESAFFTDRFPLDVTGSESSESISDVEWRILDEDGNTVAEGTTGEGSESFTIPEQQVPLWAPFTESEFYTPAETMEVTRHDEYSGIEEIEWRILDEGGRTLYGESVHEEVESFTIPEQPAEGVRRPQVELVTPFGENPRIEVRFPDWHGDEESVQLELLDTDGEVIDSRELTPADHETPHTETFELEPPAIRDVKFRSYDADDEEVRSRDWRDLAAGAYHGTSADPPEAAISHRAASDAYEFDRDTRYPAYMAGQVLVDGDPAARDVLILDNRSFELLYRPRVHQDGTWELRNIPTAPRREWRAFMVIARDPRRRYNSKVIDHVRPKLVEEED